MNGQPHDRWKFLIGYDDFYDTDPLGNDVIFRYGKHWNLECLVKLEQTVSILPQVDGTRSDTESFIETTNLPFSLNIYKDDTFQTVTIRYLDPDRFTNGFSKKNENEK